MEKQQHPIVFISYSHDTDDHKAWVRKLADYLCRHGVDIILDQFDMRLGGDLPFFMEQGLSNSQLVLCVCSDIYVEKANAGKGGAGYEKKIMSADLMADATKDYIIPIKRNNNKGKMPTFLRGTLYIDFNDDAVFFSKYRELLERIYDEDTKKRPPLGENPFKQKKISERIATKLEIEKVEYYNPLLVGHVSFDYKKNSGHYIIGTGEFAFNTYWSECGHDSIYCCRDSVKRIGYNPDFTDYPDADEIESFDFSSRVRTIRVGQIVVLENHNNKFAAIKITEIFRNNADINHLLKFDYKIYEDLEIENA
jgi:sefir domain protein|nr:MAG TPA: TIR domain [Caudoviricetes sp.]